MFVIDLRSAQNKSGELYNITKLKERWSSTPRLRAGKKDLAIPCVIRIDGVYLACTSLQRIGGLLAIFASCEINKLRCFNRAFSPIPTAPTKTSHSQRFILEFNNNKPFNNN